MTVEIDQFLAKYGDDVNATDSEGKTLLHKAAQLGKLEVVEFLVSKGADVNAKSEYGLTPLFYAKANQHMMIVEYFKSIGGRGQTERIQASDKKVKQKNFPSLDSLESLRKVLDEVDAALSDRNRTIVNSAMPEVLAGALGMRLGGAGSFAALVGLGTAGLSAAGITSGLATAGGVATAVGIGVSPMVAGIFVLATPIAAAGAVGVGIAAAWKHRRLKHEKISLLQRAIKTQHTNLMALKNEVDATKERADYLNSINILLQRGIRDLKADLGQTL